jgi:signal peptidase I
MTVAKAEQAKREADRERDLVQAADGGPRAFYKVAGYGKLAGILVGTVVIAVVAHHLLQKQDFLLGSLAVFLAVFVLSTIGSATPWGVRNRARGEAKGLRKSGERLLSRNRGKLSEAAAQDVEAALRDVDKALKGDSDKGALPALEARWRLNGVLDEHLGFARKSAAREYTESIGGAILVALLLRAFVFEPFHIPSGSMIPTLLVGDFIFVNKMSYGLRIPFTDPAKVHKLWERSPQRGDVVVFINPQRPEQDYVKRVIGLPGDRIDVRDNLLFVNGVEQKHTDVGDFTYRDHSEYTGESVEVTAHQYIEDLDGKKHPIIVRRDPIFARSGSWVVEPGRVFMMGDNRDNSADSRVEGGIGEIPFSYLKGRASIIWISFGGPAVIRFDRMFRGVN